MTNEEISDAVSYIKSYRKLDENLHNTVPKGSVSFYATEKCLHYWDMAIKALEQESNVWSLDDAREDFTHDVYNTLDFLPTNDEANRIIDSFDRVTRSIKQEPILDKIRAEIMSKDGLEEALEIIDRCMAESEKQ